MVMAVGDVGVVGAEVKVKAKEEALVTEVEGAGAGLEAGETEGAVAVDKAAEAAGAAAMAVDLTEEVAAVEDRKQDIRIWGHMLSSLHLRR